jgi:hypothetical protein
MITMIVQVAIRLALSGLPNTSPCNINWDCTGGICDNPVTLPDSGWELTCCQGLGSTCTTNSDCCTFGSSYVTCSAGVDDPEMFCGIYNVTPGVDAGLITCETSADCTQYTYNLEISYECDGVFLANGEAEREYFLPWDVGFLWLDLPDGGTWYAPYVLEESYCNYCYQPHNSTGTWVGGLNPCSLCCSNNCYESSTNDAICCSNPGQPCLADPDCCGNTPGQTESCFLTTSCDPNGGGWCSDGGMTGTCALIDGQICTADEQCRSGNCSDAGRTYECQLGC